MIAVQAGDIFSTHAIAGFDRLLFGGAVLVAAAAWHPEVTAYLRRNTTLAMDKAAAHKIRKRPLGWRTVLVSTCGAWVAAGALTAIAPERAVFALILVAGFVGAAVAASVWTAVALVPLARMLPEGDPPGAVGGILRRMGRGPLDRSFKVLTWSMLVGASIGAALDLYRRVRTGDSAHALALVALCTMGAMVSGYVLWLAVWAGSVGECVRMGEQYARKMQAEDTGLA